MSISWIRVSRILRWSFLIAVPAIAAPVIVLDQSHQETRNSWIEFSRPALEHGTAQTVRVGVTGVLAAVDIQYSAAAPDELVIRNVSSGAPGGVVLGRVGDGVQISGNHAEGWVRFDVSALGIPVVEGQSIALEPIAHAFPYGEWAGTSYVDPTYSYGSGAPFLRDGIGTEWVEWIDDFFEVTRDQCFRTWVEIDVVDGATRSWGEVKRRY